MKILKSALIAFAFLWTMPANAQNASDIIFSEIEKRVIKDYFGVDPNRQTTNQTNQQNRMPDWADREQVRYDNDRDEDRKDINDDDDDEDRGDKKKKHKKDKKNKKKNKDKKNKNKSEGKSKGKSKDMPYGLSKRSSLPPGLQKQLDRNGRLPQGLAKRNLPADLQSKLTTRPPEQEVTIVDKDVVLLDKATGVILDVIYDVVVKGKNVQTPSVPMTNGTLTEPNPQPQSQPPAQKTEPGVIDSIFKTIFGGNN